MALQSEPVVLSDLVVDADDAALAQQLEDRRIEHQRSSMGHPTLDDHVGSDLPDELLHHQDVLRRLDDRDAQPGHLVADLVLPTRSCVELRQSVESCLRVDVEVARAFGRAHLDLRFEPVVEQLWLCSHGRLM